MRGPVGVAPTKDDLSPLSSLDQLGSRHASDDPDRVLAARVVERATILRVGDDGHERSLLTGVRLLYPYPSPQAPKRPVQ